MKLQGKTLVVVFTLALAAKQAVLGCGKVLFGPGARSIDNMLREPDKPGRLWPLYTLVLIVVVALSFVGAIKLGREALLVWAVALYFVVLAGGPESNSRFRTPITPMLAVLAVAEASTQKETA